MSPSQAELRPHRFLTILAAALAWIAAPEGIAAAEPADPIAFPYPVVEHVLADGLRVYAVPMPTPGVVAWQTRMSVGSGEETEPGRTGFAHFFEHLLFHGTETTPQRAREQEQLRLGVRGGGWTSIDETTYPAVLPTSSLPRWIELQADLFQHLSLTPEGVRREAGAVYGEFRKSSADPENVLEEDLMAKLWGTHPYGHSTLGYEQDIAAMPGAVDAARAFFSEWYRPERAAIVVAGDVVPEELFSRIEAAYADWGPAPSPPAEAPTPAPGAPARVELTWPSPTEPVLLVLWAGPPRSDATFPALQWAGHLLSAPGGPLDTRLVRAGLARSATADVEDGVQASWLEVRVVAADAGDLAEIERVVLEEAGHLAEGPPADRLEALRTRERYALLSRLDDPARVADFVGHEVRRDPDPAAIDARLRAQAAVSSADVAAVAGALLRPDAAFVGSVVGGTP